MVSRRVGVAPRVWEIGSLFIFPNLTKVSAASPHLAFRSTMVACCISVADSITVREIHINVVSAQENTFLLWVGLRKEGGLKG